MICIFFEAISALVNFDFIKNYLISIDEFFAIVISLRPVVIIIPWILRILKLMFVRILSKLNLVEEHKKTHQINLIDRNQIDKNLRDVIVLYLIAGVKKIVRTMYIRLNENYNENLPIQENCCTKICCCRKRQRVSAISNTYEKLIDNELEEPEMINFIPFHNLNEIEWESLYEESYLIENTEKEFLYTKLSRNNIQSSKGKVKFTALAPKVL